MEEESIKIIYDEIRKHNTGVISTYTNLLKTGEVDVDNRILSEIIDLNLKEGDKNFSELINEFTPKNMFKTAQILLERGEKKNAIKILQNCMIKCCSDKDENNNIKDETTLRACFDKFKELKINLLDNFEPIKNIKNFDSQSSKIIETYLKIAEFSIKDNIGNIKNVDKIFLNISKTIDKIDGNFLIIDKNGRDKDILNEFYANFTQLNPELFTKNLSCNCIKMYQTFVLKGSRNILGSLLGAYKYLEQKNEVSKEIAELINNRMNLMMKLCDKYEYHDNLRLLLPYLFEKGDEKSVKKYFDKYYNAIEQLKNSNNSFDEKAYYEVAKELIRLIDGIARNLNKFPFVIDKLEDLCDNFPYKTNNGNAITTDYVKISQSRIKFKDFAEDVNKLKTIIKKNENEIKNLNSGIANTSNKIEINKITEKAQILANKIEKDEEILKNKAKDFFDKIENGYLHYSFILNNIDKIEKIEDLVPTFKGRTKEILTNIIQKQFEEKINSLNELFSKEKTEDRDKKINREITSLAKLVGDMILSNKYNIDLGSNKSNIEKFFDNLEANSNNLFLSLNTLKYEEELKKIKSVLLEKKTKTSEENKAEFEEIKNVLEEENEISEIDKNNLETYIDNLKSSASDLFISIKEEEQTELEQTEKSFANSINGINLLDKPIGTPTISNP